MMVLYELIPTDKCILIHKFTPLFRVAVDQRLYLRIFTKQ